MHFQLCGKSLGNVLSCSSMTVPRQHYKAVACIPYVPEEYIMFTLSFMLPYRFMMGRFTMKMALLPIITKQTAVEKEPCIYGLYVFTQLVIRSDDCTGSSFVTVSEQITEALFNLLNSFSPSTILSSVKNRRENSRSTTCHTCVGRAGKINSHPRFHPLGSH